MKCRSCEFENAAEANFCAQCGGRLELSCPSCGAGVGSEHQFCQNCGHALQSEATAEAPATEIAERRQVTVLFADLTGFTQLADGMDAEETHALLNRYFEAVDGVVESFGGSIDKHIGDAVMAVFGAPVAHTDDPERAVRAALDIHGAVKALDPPLTVHIGIASGQVVASGTGSEQHREYTVTGGSVNLASRLTAMAEGGQTLISDAVRFPLVEQLDAESFGAAEVRGIDRPVQIWRVRSFQAEPARHERPFVGRQRELRQFEAALQNCLETGTGEILYIRGEPGIGKSSLVDEFSRRAEAQGFQRHTGLVLDFGVGKGQDAIRAIVRSLLAMPSAGDEAARRLAAEQAVETGLVGSDLVMHFYDLLDLPQPPLLRGLFDAMDNDTRNRGQQETVAELARNTAKVAPVMLKVEDLHWAGGAVLGNLAGIAASVGESPLLLVMTSRIEGDPLDQMWRAATQGVSLTTIDLGPLRQAEALALAGEFIDASNRFAKRCVERAAGNPLFLEQLLRSADETSEDQLPGSVQGIVQARMDNLEAADREALQGASVMGQRFSLEALRHVIGSPNYAPDGLIAHFLVRPEGAGFLFGHALIQEGVYASLVKVRRHDLHQRAAEWFRDRDPVLRAEHLDRAEDPAAAAAYLEAASVDIAAYRYESALSLAERGLALTDDNETRFALTSLVGDVARELGQAPKSIAAFEQALKAAATAGEKSRANIGLAEGMRILDRFDEGFAALAEAEADAVSEHSAADLSRIHYLRGNYNFPLGDIDGCLAEHGKALQFAHETGSPEAEARALGGLGDANYMRGRMITAYGYFDRCVGLAQAHDLTRIEVPNLPMRGNTNQFMNRLDPGLQDCSLAIEKAQQVGLWRAEIVARAGVYAWIKYDQGQISEAIRESEISLEIARSFGAGRFESMTMVFLSKLRTLEGDRDRGRSFAEEAISIAKEASLTFSGPMAYSALALAHNDLDRRQQALTEGEQIFEQRCVSHNYFYFYRDAIEVSLDEGAFDDVERYAAALEAYTAAEPLPWTDLFIARGRGLAAHGRGRRDDALRQELMRLQDEITETGHLLALPAIEAALRD